MNTIKSERSYFKWGLNQLMERLDDSDHDNNHETIHQFIEEMDDYACKNPITSLMFSCAADAGRAILNNEYIPYIHVGLTEDEIMSKNFGKEK